MAKPKLLLGLQTVQGTMDLTDVYFDFVCRCQNILEYLAYKYISAVLVYTRQCYVVIYIVMLIIRCHTTHYYTPTVKDNSLVLLFEDYLNLIS